MSVATGALRSTRTSLPLSQNALTVLRRRYLKKDEHGQAIEAPEEMFRRVAHNIAAAEERYPGGDAAAREREFLEAMTTLKLMPNSPTLMNAGRELQQLSACFVLPILDDMNSIFTTVRNTALIHKSGGGTGFSFSRLRPANDVVQSTRGVSSGPVSFMTVFDAATEAIKQGGTRRGANMAVLRVDHPDIEAFIHAKEEQDRLNNFNISVAVTEGFMEAVERNDTYELINPRTNEPVATRNAREVFSEIVSLAWKYGDPGIVFMDRINRDNPTPALGEIESTNPCGEQPLLPYESCNLGSINLAQFVTEDDGRRVFDYPELRKTIFTAVRFLDNVIDMNNYPLPEIRQMTLGNRKIGLGVMGWADALILLGIPYDSEQAIETAEEVMGFLRDAAREASAQLARERGAFPNWQGSIYNGSDGMRLRNATVTTIAPTGTISIIAGCSSGIEPLFAICFSRHVLDGDELVEVNPIFERIARERGIYTPELVKDIAEHGSIQEMYSIPDDIRRLFVIAHDIAPEWHIRMQAAFQQFTDNAVSKTVNFRNEATKEDVARVYQLAYQLNCKGVTIYRDGSRDEQVLTTGRKDAQPGVDESGKVIPRPREEVVTGKTRKMNTGCGNLYVTINSDDRGMFEVFTAMGKAGGCAASQNEAIGRLVSLALRSNVSPEAIVEQLQGISCHRPAWEKGGRVLSCADAISKAIQRTLQENTGQQRFNFEPTPMIVGACPECGGPIEHEGGCETCRACGYSECD